MLSSVCLVLLLEFNCHAYMRMLIDFCVWLCAAL